MKVLKWGGIIIGVLIVLIVAALLIIPLFVDIQNYKPEIEKKVAEATGRPFTLGGDLRLSLFPWAGVALSDLHLGNPPEFEEKDLLSVKSFEVRVKLLPLLSKDIQVRRFVMVGPRIVLEKLKDGRGNWEGIGKATAEAPSEAPAKEGEPSKGLPVKSLVVGEFSITEGSVLWIDHAKGERKEVSDFSLRLDDVSLDRPIGLDLSARWDGKPLSLQGKVGPVGKEPGRGKIPLDIVLKALEELELGLKGHIVDPTTSPQFEIALLASPFSPRKLLAELGQGLPLTTADPKALNSMAFEAQVKGNTEEVTISRGKLDLDDSHLTFSVQAKEFSKPDVAFDLKLDDIDLDRYLPPPSEKPAEGMPKAKAPSEPSNKPDYSPLRQLVLDGSVRIGKLKAQGAKMQDLHLKVSAKDGRFRLDPLTLNLYQGGITAQMTMDVHAERPKSKATLQAKGVQTGPLLKDVADKDFIEGTMDAQVDLQMQGDEAERVKRTLNGKGEILFTDGAITGIDLAGMVRNVKATFGLAKKGEKRPRTDFSELRMPFTITNGLFHTPGTTLMSPLLRVQAKGDAELVKETLDFRVEPKFVGTLKGQGDTMERAGIMVPVMVGGTFESPTFKPDLKGMIKQVGEVPKLPDLKEKLSKPSTLEKLVPGQKKQEADSESFERKGKGIIKALPLSK